MSARPAYLPAAERRERTVEAVIDLAATQNPADITTTDIARRMGVTQGALFRHFPTKNAILEAVIDWVAARLMARIDRAVRDATSPLAAIEATFDNHIDLIARHPGVPRMLFGELQRAEPTPARQMAQTLLRRYNERLRSLIIAGKEAGELAATTDEAAAATLFIGMIQGLAVQALVSGDTGSIHQNARAIFAVYRQALINRP